jgi:hypothetical protein
MSLLRIQLALLGFYAEARVLADRRPMDSTLLAGNGSRESSARRSLRRRQRDTVTGAGAREPPSIGSDSVAPTAAQPAKTKHPACEE